jgi:hypothetical protein
LVSNDDDLAVEDTPIWDVVAQRRNELGEVPRERLFIATAELDMIAITKNYAAKAIPLGFVNQPACD